MASSPAARPSGSPVATPPQAVVGGADGAIRLLVVGDEPLVHRLAGRLLAQAGSGAARVHIASAQSGRDAVAVVAEGLADGQPFAVALVDVLGPDWDGFETVEHLWQADPRLQILLCTGCPAEHHESRVAQLAPGDRLLMMRKPLDGLELRQLVQAMGCKWRLERARTAQLAELEALVAERTRALELSHAELLAADAKRDGREAELRLADKLQAVGQLAAGVAQGLNTPLQAVHDNTCFLETAFQRYEALVETLHEIVVESDDAFVSERVAFARRRARVDSLAEQVPVAIRASLEGLGTASEIIREFEVFGQVDGSEGASVIGLAEVVEATVPVVASVLEPVADLHLELGRPALVRGRLSELNESAHGLLMNAAQACERRHRPTGRGRITVRTGADHAWAWLEVEDDGCGIAAAIRHRVFEQFFTTRESGEGRGQGLSIARLVAERHGGTLTFESEEGRGTTFRLRLPAEGACRRPEPARPDGEGAP